MKKVEPLSKIRCPECGSLNIEYLFEGEDGWCHDCGLHFLTSDAPIATIFDHITQSVETLAEKLVYHVKEKADSGTYSYWRSTISCDVWLKKSEAIAATVEEMKKEWKEQENE